MNRMTVRIASIDYDIATVLVTLDINDFSMTYISYKPQITYNGQTVIANDEGGVPIGKTATLIWRFYLDGLTANRNYSVTTEMLYLSKDTNFQWTSLGVTNTNQFTTKQNPGTEDTPIPASMTLYRAAEQEFTSNGKGGLPDAIEAQVYQNVQTGEFDLTFQYPSNGVNADGLIGMNIVTAKPEPTKEIEPFRIYEVEKTIDGMLTVYCHHVSYDFNYVDCGNFKASSLYEAVDHVNHRFGTFNEVYPFRLRVTNYVVSDIEAGYENTITKPARTVLYEMAEVYGFEIEWKRWRCYIHTRRGADTNFKVEYGVNMTGMTYRGNVDSTYTAILPVWSKTQEVTLNGTRVKGTRTKEGNELDQTAQGTAPYKRLLLYDVSSVFTEEPLKADMDTVRDLYVSLYPLNVPEVTIDLGMIEEADIQGSTAPRQSLHIGDTIKVYVERQGIDVTMRLIETRYDVRNDRYESIVAGNREKDLGTILEERLTKIREKISQETARDDIQDTFNGLSERTTDLEEKVDDVNGDLLEMISDLESRVSDLENDSGSNVAVFG